MFLIALLMQVVHLIKGHNKAVSKTFEIILIVITARNHIY